MIFNELSLFFYNQSKFFFLLLSLYDFSHIYLLYFLLIVFFFLGFAQITSLISLECHVVRVCQFFHPHFWLVCFFFYICVVIIFILLWICIRIRNVFLLLILFFCAFRFIGFESFFFHIS